jgi:hypothetical protein
MDTTLPTASDSRYLRLVPVPADARASFPVTHPYLELVYMPLLGPTAVSLMRRLDWLVSSAEGPTTVETAALAAELGLKRGCEVRPGARSPVWRGVNRLAHAHLVRWLGPEDLGVCGKVPALSAPRVASLPPAAQRAHEALLKGGLQSPDLP